MDITHLNSNVLRRLLSLSEKKEALLQQISQIEKELVSLTGRSSGSQSSSTAQPSGVRIKGVRGKRGALKSKILALLSAAGENGVRIQDIATHLDIPVQNVYVWFSSTGKNLKDIKKVSPGRYRLKSSPPATPAGPQKANA